MIARDVVQSFGRYHVVRESMTDGAYVFSVVFPSDDGGEIVLACFNRPQAARLASTLQESVVDVSIRDREIA